MKCKLFGCVYAIKDGCSIKGYMDKEGPINGTKSYCTHYDDCTSNKEGLK